MTLKDVIETGANDVYVIENTEHGEVLDSGDQRVYPCSVDIEKGR